MKCFITSRRPVELAETLLEPGGGATAKGATRMSHRAMLVL
jgi:hypothetical protein